MAPRTIPDVTISKATIDVCSPSFVSKCDATLQKLLVAMQKNPSLMAHVCTAQGGKDITNQWGFKAAGIFAIIDNDAMLQRARSEVSSPLALSDAYIDILRTVVQSICWTHSAP